ncbi:MAG TPA: single-stranded DNA-binding protein [Agromyces sp.]|nr:single-stranded DNA-binding protein [Agromyces sp.]
MTDLVTVTGVVGSDPRHTVTAAGLAITNFRLASTRRYFDRASGQWTDGETNWYTVASFRQLALNTAKSLRKGERVVVHGRVRVRAWETAEKSGTAIEIEADSVGHDLAWGVSAYSKTTASRTAESAPEPESSEANAVDDAWAAGSAGWITGASDPDTGAAVAGVDPDPSEDADPVDALSEGIRA